MNHECFKCMGLGRLIISLGRLLDCLFSSHCMAGDGTKSGKKITCVSPNISLATLLFILLIVVRTTGKREQDLSTTPAEIRSKNVGSLQTVHLLPHAPKRVKPDRLWRKRVFNAADHDVPSGPNPISNR
ncbi:hypothetical protein NE237_002554 [Protea cynaroides]|uniref:Uncharacterized protein n=1 Tax=Protea cynaroides TaxID=273540 RepID=A0A9Q0KV98_9MAGN|nr:hypothetical protein NE237_002554 [Protea cynaroides]